MNKIKPGVDIVLDVLKETLAAFPAASFVSSLLFQYQERGGLSKKQLEGLYSKASKVPGISTAKMATLQAIILKKHTRHRSEPAVTPTIPEKDDVTPRLISEIIARYPHHKTILFYQLKLTGHE